MNRIDRTFGKLARAGRKALVPYVTAGHPSRTATAGILDGLVRGGADIIELGLPFSDPMADGPVIQRACETAVRAGIGVDDVLGMVGEFRQVHADTPVVIMGYLNPLVRYGVERFAAGAAEAGVDGVLMVDAPPEESAVLEPLRACGIHQIFLLAPTSSDERMERVLQRAEGFVYYVSLTGITGAAGLDSKRIAEHIARIRSRTRLPVGVGFGIKTAGDAVAVAASADAVVIGSALVSALDDTTNDSDAAECARQFLAPIREALDTAKMEMTG